MNRKVVITGVSIGIAAIVAIAVIGMALAVHVGKRPAVGTPAPNFALGLYPSQRAKLPNTVSLSDLRGKVVVLNFWASWCIPCRDEAPILERIFRDYGHRGVVFLGIGYLDVERDALRFMQEFDVTYANGADLQQQIAKSYRITGVPETFVIDQGGIVRKIWIQPLSSTKELGDVLDSLIAQIPM